jgi:DNA-binding CsgD family transcriptional regulator
MELAKVVQAVRALRRARDGQDFVLLAAGVIDGILRVLTADVIWFNDVEASGKWSATLMLWPPPLTGEPRGAARQELGEALTWTGASSVGHTLVMPLPAPAGNSRRLVFMRQPGCAFSDEDRSAAILLQPHIADALRCQSRLAAARLLTGRQQELLRLVAAGHDNIEIARRLSLSPCTVRKHLENVFARLEVTSRTAAVAKVCPDATWLDPVGTFLGAWVDLAVRDPPVVLCLCGAPLARLSAAAGPRGRLAYAGALGVRLAGRLVRGARSCDGVDGRSRSWPLRPWSSVPLPR